MGGFHMLVDQCNTALQRNTSIVRLVYFVQALTRILLRSEHLDQRQLLPDSQSFYRFQALLLRVLKYVIFLVIVRVGGSTGD